jgi:tetratricopeptide (TPR) repeat protein
VIFTFYSYKGGVGRSMALANVAVWLRDQGLRVAMVDWDLEAPGLENFFFAPGPRVAEIAGQIGVIDTLLSYRRVFPRLAESLAGKPLADKVAVLDEALPPLASALTRIERESPGGDLLLMTAGLRSPEHFDSYARNVQSFDWADFYKLYEGEAYFDWMRRELLAEADVVLIDSRTGVNEMSGVCAQQLADVVVSLSAPNLQNLDGVASMAASFCRGDLVEKRGRPIQMVIVPTRIDNFSPPLINEFERRFLNKTQGFTPSVFHSMKSNFWALKIPYAPGHSYRETIVVGDSNADKDLVLAYKRLGCYLTLLAPPQARLRTATKRDVEAIIGRLLPQVAILHAPADGEAAAAVRRVLGAANISVWPDPETQAGVDVRGAVNSLLDQSHFLVVLLTANAIESAEIRAAWRRARQLGLTVVPVAASADDLGALSELPGWMALPGVVMLDKHTDRLVATLTSAPIGVRVPLMGPDIVEDWVGRERQLEQIKSLLLGSCRRAALCGPSGSGKTALAAAFAHDDKALTFFNDGVFWISAAEPAKLQDEFAKMYYALTGEQPTSASASETAAQLTSRMSKMNCLLVVDDLDDASVLRAMPFAASGRQLLITDDRAVAVRAEAAPVMIGALDSDEALAVLAHTGQMREGDAERVIKAVGTLPGALKVAGAVMSAAATQAAAGGDQSTPVSLDRVANRVASSMAPSFLAALNRLEPLHRDRAADLAFAIEDTPLDLAEVGHLWAADRADVLATLTRLTDLGLLETDGTTVRMAPAIRSAITAALPQRDVDKMCEAAYARVTADPALTRIVLCRHVRLTDSGVEPRSVALNELAPNEAVVSQLEAVQLIAVADGSASLNPPAAARQWRRLREWVKADRDFLVWRQRLASYIDDWHRTQDDGALLSGALLAEAQRWSESRPRELSRRETDYVDVSVAARRLRQLAGHTGDTTIVPGRAAATTSLAASAPAAPARRMRPQLLAGAAALVVLVAATMIWRATTTPGAPVESSTTLSSIAAADDAIARGDLTAALVAYNAAIEASPRDAALYARRGAVRFAQHEVKRALEDFDRSIARDPNVAQVHYLRAGARANNGNVAGAIEDYSTAIRLDPNLANAYFERSNLYEAAGKRDEAIADLKQAANVTTDDLTVRAAQARLTRLGAAPSTAPQPATVYIHYQDRKDGATAESIAKRLSARGFTVAGTELVPAEKAKTSGDVRFLPQDQSAGIAVRSAAETALADEGYNLKLQSITLSAKVAPADANAGSGKIPPVPSGRTPPVAKAGSTIELWLPSLSAPAPPPSAIQQMPRKY